MRKARSLPLRAGPCAKPGSAGAGSVRWARPRRRSMRPRPSGGAGPSEALAGFCPAGRPGPCRSRFDIGNRDSWREMTENRVRALRLPPDRKQANALTRGNDEPLRRRLVAALSKWRFPVISRHEKRQARARPRAKDRRIRIRIHAPAEPHITSARQRARCDNIPVPLSRFATLDEGRDAAMLLSLPRYFTTSTGIFDACSSLWLTLPRYSLKPLRPRLPTTTKS